MTVTEVFGVMKRAKPNVSITILNRAIYFQYFYTSVLQWFIDKGFGFTFQPELNKQSISYVNNQKCILVNFLSQNGIDSKGVTESNTNVINTFFNFLYTPEMNESIPK